MARIILSYRRADSAGMTGRIFDRLAAQYGQESVFMDIDIPYGIDFRNYINEALHQADILLVIVGPKWTGPGRRNQLRINQPNDPVRIEVETAMKRGITVIPVLVDGAIMPGAVQLADGLQDFAYLNAATVDAGRDFHHHIDRLIRSMDVILAERQKSLAPHSAAEPTPPADPIVPAREPDAADEPSAKLDPVLQDPQPPPPSAATQAPGNPTIEWAIKEKQEALGTGIPTELPISMAPAEPAREPDTASDLAAAAVSVHEVGPVSVGTIESPQAILETVEPTSTAEPEHVLATNDDPAVASKEQYAPSANGTAYGPTGSKSRTVRIAIAAAAVVMILASAILTLVHERRIVSDRGDKTVAVDPVDAAGFYNRGRAYADKGDYDRAIQDFDRAIELDPNSADAFNSRGNAYYNKDDYDRAVQDYDRAIRLDPKDAIAFYNRGKAYSKKGDYDRAVQDYGKAIQLDSKYVSAFNGRADAYSIKGDLDRAIQDYSRVIQLEPDAVAFNNRCYERAKAGRLQGALEDCNESLRLRPDDADTLDSRGFTYLKMRQFDSAIADYDAALGLNPDQANPLYGRGMAKLKKGDTAGGKADIAAAKAIKANIAEELARYGVR